MDTLITNIGREICDVLHDDTMPGSLLVVGKDVILRLYENGTYTELISSSALNW